MKKLYCIAAVALLAACSPDAGPEDAAGEDIAAIDAPGDATPDDLQPDARDVSEPDAADTTDADTLDAADTAPDVEPPAPVENAGVTASQSGDVLSLKNAAVEVRYRLKDGLFDIDAINGPARIRDAESRVTAVAGDAEVIYGTMGRPGATWAGFATSDALGDGVDVEIVFPATESEPKLVLLLGLRGDKTFLVSHVTVFWPSELGADVRIRYLSPLVADHRTTGALFLGADPSRHIVLDNGSDVYFDYQSRIFRMGYGDSFLFQPGTVSNWSMAVKDPDSPANLVAGFLSNDRAIGMVRVDYMAKYSQEVDGIHSFHAFEGFGYYDPPRPLLPAADDSLDDFMTLPGEPFYVDMDPPTPQEGLENWGSSVASFHGKTVWQDVPTGWNSWGGGGGSNGYSQDIFTQRIMDNYSAMLEDFAPYGQKYFLLDDGWQKDHGDWVTNRDKFPDVDGVEFMKWFAGQVTAAGLRPGLWIAPFWVKKTSDLYAAHPDWFAEINDFGTLLVHPDNNVVLDLTNPEVKTWLHDLFTRLSQDWGYKFIKIDFAYWALFNKNMYDPTKTAAEAYVDAMKIIRDAVGPDTFLLGVAAVGLDMGIMDSCRMTLDNYPQWGDDKQQSIKVTLATAAHRYYMSRVWVNHPDLLFFRPEPLGLTFAEARAWASFVAIYGGIVKNAEPYIDMHEHQEWLDVVRPMIPVYPRTARPLDMFELSFPEYWLLPVDRDDRSWNVVGLFNWGLNEDLAQSAPIAEAARDKTIRWSDLGLPADETVLLFNVWDRTCEWATGPEWTMTAQPRTGTLLVVRRDTGLPQVVFTTRHLLGGAVEIRDETVTDGGGTLEFSISNPAGHEVTVYIESPAAPTAVTTPADAAITDGPCENVWAVTFTPDQDDTPVQVAFD